MSAPDLSRFALLAELTPEDLAVLAPLLDERVLAGGRQLFREGQEADELYLLRSGRLRFESRRSGELGKAAAGTAVGALSLVAVGAREATAVADEESELWVLSRTAFHRLSEDSPRAACRLLEAVLRETAGALREGLDRLS